MKKLDKKRPRPSYICKVIINCGACEQEIEVYNAGIMWQAGEGCACGPETYTCFCRTGASMECQCPSCKYWMTIEL